MIFKKQPLIIFTRDHDADIEYLEEKFERKFGQPVMVIITNEPQWWSISW